MKVDALFIVLSILAAASALFLMVNVILAPLLTLFRGLFRPLLPVEPRPVNSITVVVPAYNEAMRIPTKIETLRVALRELDVPFEVLIGSDGSTDGTADIARAELAKFDSKHWHVMEFPNEGKCSTINKLVASATGDIIVSTDADIPVPESSVRLALAAFQENPALGCASCVPCFEGLNIGSQKSYWSLEDQIRAAESRLGRLIVVTGMLYAYRRDLFAPIPPGVMADDLWIPLNVMASGYQSVQVASLRVPYEKTDERIEIARRRRVIVGGMDVIGRMWRKLCKSPALLLLVYWHKINRWALPLWLAIFLLSAALLFPAMLIGYLAVAVLLYLRLGRERLSGLLQTVWSPALAFVQYLRSADFARWEHTRKH